MVTTPGSSSVTAASKPLAVECVWNTCCFPLIFYALPLQGLQALFPTTSQPAVLSQSAFLGSPIDPKAKISLLNFLSEFCNFSLELSILPFKEGAHSSLELGFTAVFPTHSFLPGRSSMGASKQLSFATPSPRHFWKTQPANSMLNGRLSRAFFSFQKGIKWCRQDKKQKNPTVSILSPIFNIWGNDPNFQCFNVSNYEGRG